MLEVR